MRRVRGCLPVLAMLLLAMVSSQVPAQPVADAGVAQRSVLLMLRLPPAHYRPDAAYGDGYGGSGHASRRRLARSLARTHALALREDWPMPALGLDCFVLVAGDAAAAGRAARALARDPRVESAQPMQLFHTLGEDPLAATQPVMAQWHLDEIHRRATGRGVRVAIIDSGVDARHPDLRGQVASLRNLVDARTHVAERHGTQVAGVIAARGGNGGGIVGAAPDARLLALRACWQAPDAPAATCSSLTLARALQVVIDAKPEVLNLSLAGPQDALLARLLDVVLRRGTTVVAAADRPAAFPASHPGVIAVSTEEVRIAGTWQAPGRGIPAPVPGGGWTLAQGSSFAAAEVSGLVADLRQRAPGISGARLRIALGAPRGIDACAALSRARDGCVCGCATASATMAEPHR